MTPKLEECRERLAELYMWTEIMAFEWDYFVNELEFFERRLEEVDSKDVKKVEEIEYEIAMVYKNFEDISEDFVKTKPKLDETYKEFLTLLEQEYDEISEEEYPELLRKTKAEISNELRMINEN